LQLPYPSSDQIQWQLEQQRQLAAAQWQAQQVQIEQLEALTNQNVATSNQPEATAALQATPPVDLVEQLTQLAALRDQGILTEEEFSTEKAKLLKRD